MPLRNLSDRRSVGRPGRLDRIEMIGRRKERLTDDRVLEDVEQVGGVSPHVLVRSARDLLAELPPRRRTISLRAIRIGRAEEGRDRLADRVVEGEAVVAQLDERERPQTGERILGSGFRQHGGQEGHRRPAHDRGRVEGLPRTRIEDAQIDLGQPLDDRLHGDGLEADLGPFGKGRSGEPKG